MLGFIDAIEVLDSDTTPIATCEAQLAAVRAHIAGLDESVRIMGPALLAPTTLNGASRRRGQGPVPAVMLLAGNIASRRNVRARVCRVRARLAG